MRELGIDYGQHDFQFTRRWFLQRNLTTFCEHVHPEWAGKMMTYLELGCFEGMSMVWMMQRVLGHPDSRAVAVDPWLITTKISGAEMELVMQRAHHNLKPWMDYTGTPPDPKCRLIRGNSAEVLRRMLKRGGCCGIGKGGVSLALVDGNHNALAVLDDLRLVRRLVRKGGWILLDDVENDRKKTDHVKQGLDMWVEEAGDSVERIWKHKYCECWRTK